MKAKLPTCDRCGAPFKRLADAVVAQRYDDLGRCTELQLDHTECAVALVLQLDDLGRDDAVVSFPAGELLDPERASRLRSTARGYWASASKLLDRIERLAVHELAHDVRRRPVSTKSP